MFVWSKLCAVTVLLAIGVSSAPGSCLFTPSQDKPLPVIFVHGNGDDAAKWLGIVWLFESNGYPADRLSAIRFLLPSARSDDSRDEPYRSSTVDAAAELSGFVTRTLITTGSRKVVLIGSSRGGLTMRNYIQNGGGAANVACAILAGTPNHGVMAIGNSNNEFNGKGRFLQALNQPGPDGSEVVAGVQFLTLLSDKLDKYAQPTGIGLGRPQMATGISYDGPSLKGANNVVMPNLDHRELAFQPAAFAEMYKFITGSAPRTLKVTPEAAPVLSGLVTGFENGAPTNLPLAGVHLRIVAISSSASETEAPVYEITTKSDGRWGPFTPSPTQEYEFDLEYQGRHVSYYKAPIPRSTSLLNLRFAPVPRNRFTQTGTGPQLLIDRPQGYFSRDRDPVLIDGKPVAEEPAGLPVEDAFIVNTASTSPATVTLRGETIVAKPSEDLAKDLAIVDFLW